MNLPIAPQLQAVAEPPIAEAHAWVAGRDFPADKPLIDVAQAVPGYAPADALIAHLGAALAEPKNVRYTEILGRMSLRAALARHMNETYSGDVSPEQVGITAGCNQAFCLAMMTLAASGDEVILPAPYYFNHQMWLEMLGVRPVHMPFRGNRGGIPDPADAATLIGPRTRAIVLVTPNNPTGAIYPPDVIAAFHALAKEAGIALVLDETYKDFLPDEAPAHGLFGITDWDETLIQLYSFSKAYSLTGFRVGSLIAAESFLAQAAKAMDCIAICAPAIAQEAALFGLENLAGYRTEKRALVLARIAAFRKLFERNDHGYELVSAGAFFAYLRHPFGGEEASKVAQRLAQEHNLLCLPGSMFGHGQEEYLRFAFANVETDLMPVIAERLAESRNR
jgi:aspartate/methionine/tyrosine aminotransferase